MKGNLLKKVISCVLGATMVTSMFVTGFSFASAEVGYINLDRTNFKITVPSAYGSNPSTYMLDGNKSTIWETDWSQGSTQLPAEILVDMGEVKENVSRVIYTPRQTDVNGKIKDYKVYAGETTDDMQLVSEGSWDWGSTNTEIAAKIDDAYADFDIPVNARYIKILVESATTKPPDPNQTITCAELNIAVEGEVEPPVPDGKIPQNEMSVEYVVSQYGGSPARNMLDGNKSTWWESDWSTSATYFEPGDYFIIDLGKVREDLSQIIFTPRQDNQNGHIFEFEIYTSAVEGDLTDTDIDNEANGFTLAGKGEWGSGTDDCTATFASRDARYVAVKVFSVGGDGNTITCGEFNAKTEAGVTVDVSALEGAIAVAQQAIIDTTNDIAKEKIQAALDAVGDVNLYVQEGVQAAADSLLETVETYATIGNVTTVKPGKVWVDNNGNAIQAHGGGILYDEKTKTYYWYGEHKGYENVPTGAETGNPGIGIGCYSSKDLLNWTYEGVALPVFNNPQLVDGTTTDDDVPMYVSEESDIYNNSPLPEFEGTASNYNGLMKSPYASFSALNSDEYIDELNALYENDNLTFEEKQQMYREFNWNRVVERPKVIYNDATGKYVMWWHQDGPRMGLYTVASAGIAISDSPTGPFKYLCTRRVTMTGVLTTGNGDGMLRDMTLFKDDDGTAYVVYSSEENATTIIHKLSDEYTGLSGDLEDISQNTPANFTEGVDYVRVFAGQYREAPAMFKDGDTYYLITSGQSGWNPNPCQYSYVEGDIFGEWAPNKKFAVNDIPYVTQQETTFRSQSTFILPIRDEDGNKVPGKFVYMGDRWFRENLQDSRYIWLPLNFNGETHEITMEWKDEWSFKDLIGDYEPEYELGDVNHDKTVDVLDVTAIQKYLVSVEDENFDVKLADVNEDGAVNIKDATTIQLKLSK